MYQEASSPRGRLRIFHKPVDIRDTPRFPYRETVTHLVFAVTIGAISATVLTAMGAPGLISVAGGYALFLIMLASTKD